MPLYRLDVLKRGAGAETGGTDYYWTNSYHAALDNLVVAEAVGRIIAQEEMAFTLAGITVVALRVSVPPASAELGVVISCDYPGQLGSERANLMLHLALRVVLWAEGRIVGFRMYRPGGGNDLVEGDHWVETGFLDVVRPLMADVFGPRLGVRQVSGAPYGDVEVLPQLRHWQLRHGTKRRARHYFG